MIKIAQRLHPYSHLPGTRLVLQKSFWGVQVFPTRLFFRHFVTDQRIDLPLPLTGPIEGFTVEQDLERGVVIVFGRAKEGYFRYTLSQETEGLLMRSKDILPERCLCEGSDHISIPEERLSLGSHKSQDWDLVRRRKDMAEIFPAWLRLGSSLPPQKSSDRVGTLNLLSVCEELIEKRDIVAILPAFQRVFMGGFSGILSPRLCDTDFQGLIPDEEILPKGVSPLLLLTEGAKAVRSLFFQQEEGEIALLPCLPPEFHSGRIVSLCTEQGDLIAIEWSKKLLRRVIWKSASKRTSSLRLQKEIKRYRARSSLKDKGSIVKSCEELELQQGKTLFLDHFEA